MDSLNLITTADEKTWGNFKYNIYLGEWCKLYSRKNNWEGLKNKTLQYHWDDSAKHYVDYQYLNKIYEKYLDELSICLNKLHCCNNSLHYWRIVVGPWLRFFIDIIYDRYSSLKEADDNENISSTIIMDSDVYKWVPKDYGQFYECISTDAWNHFIYAYIIKSTKIISYKTIRQQNEPDLDFNKGAKQSFIKKCIIILLNNYVRFIPNNHNKVFFIQSYFTIINLVKLQIKMRQIPCPYGPKVEIRDQNINIKLREKIRLSLGRNPFEKILQSLIPLQLPKAYIESYKEGKRLGNKYFPRNIKTILTANSYSHDDVFKIWAADQVQKGCLLNITQHGGLIGTSKWDQREDHQIKISNKYYSWGWEDKYCKTIHRMPATKLLHIKKINPDINGDIMITLASYPRYFYCSGSFRIASQILKSYSEQLNLLKLLNVKVIKKLKIRLNEPDFGWNLKKRFSDDGYAKNIEGPKKKLLDKLKSCRLIVATQNATVFLESFAANFPTILYWNPNHYQIRDKARPFFDELNRVGILHYCPESSAELINKIYRNPMQWWMRKEIQMAKNNFCKNYAYVNDNWMEEWKDELLNNKKINNEISKEFCDMRSNMDNEKKQVDGLR